MTSSSPDDVFNLDAALHKTTPVSDPPVVNPPRVGTTSQPIRSAIHQVSTPEERLQASLDTQVLQAAQLERQNILIENLQRQMSHINRKRPEPVQAKATGGKVTERRGVTARRDDVHKEKTPPLQLTYTKLVGKVVRGTDGNDYIETPAPAEKTRPPRARSNAPSAEESSLHESISRRTESSSKSKSHSRSRPPSRADEMPPPRHRHKGRSGDNHSRVSSSDHPSRDEHPPAPEKSRSKHVSTARTPTVGEPNLVPMYDPISGRKKMYKVEEVKERDPRAKKERSRERSPSRSHHPREPKGKELARASLGENPRRQRREVSPPVRAVKPRTDAYAGPTSTPTFGDSSRLAQARISPFTDEIMACRPPTVFHMPPKLPIYDGKTDAVAHVTRFRHLMALYGYEDAILCKTFVLSLAPEVTIWYQQLPPKSISSFDQLALEFVQRFVINKTQPRTLNQLLSLRKLKEEKLRDYVHRYWETYNLIPGCDPKVAADTFKMGLDDREALFRDLSNHPPQNMGTLMEFVELNCRTEELIESRRGIKPSTPAKAATTPNTKKQVDNIQASNKRQQPVAALECGPFGTTGRQGLSCSSSRRACRNHHGISKTYLPSVKRYMSYTCI